MLEIPTKNFYRIGEVCHLTDTQPYVLRFWESEFPQLTPRKNRSGHRVYRREDIDLVLRIKTLLYEEEYTIAGARKRLEDELRKGRIPRASRPRVAAEPPAEPAATQREAPPPAAPKGLPQARVSSSPADTLRIIAELRERLSLAEEENRRLRAAAQEATRAHEDQRRRAGRVAANLEAIVARLAGT